MTRYTKSLKDKSYFKKKELKLKMYKLLVKRKRVNLVFKLNFFKIAKLRIKHFNKCYSFIHFRGRGVFRDFQMSRFDIKKYFCERVITGLRHLKW